MIRIIKTKMAAVCYGPNFLLKYLFYVQQTTLASMNYNIGG